MTVLSMIALVMTFMMPARALPTEDDIVHADDEEDCYSSSSSSSASSCRRSCRADCVHSALKLKPSSSFDSGALRKLLDFLAWLLRGWSHN